MTSVPTIPWQVTQDLEYRYSATQNDGRITQDLEYRYSATQNDGRITQMKNWVSGKEVTYQYDLLQRQRVR